MRRLLIYTSTAIIIARDIAVGLWTLWRRRLCVLLALSMLSAPSHARGWSDLATRNVRAAAPLLRLAAARYPSAGGATLLAAVAGRETHCQALRGRRPGIYGALQVSWPAWGWLLKAEGIALQPEDLLQLEPGILAGAAVLSWLTRRYPRRSLALVLCLYGVGSPALRFRRDCRYSRAVFADLPHAARALGAAP